MGYRPFKMRGHELPGPNQRPQMSEEELLMQQNQQNVAPQGQNTTQDQPNNQLTAESTDLGALNTANDTAKKAVDVEVTVNGQKV